MKTAIEKAAEIELLASGREDFLAAASYAHAALRNEFYDVDPCVILAGRLRYGELANDRTLQQAFRYTGAPTPMRWDSHLEVLGFPVVCGGEDAELRLVPRGRLAFVEPERVRRLGSLDRIHLRVVHELHDACDARTRHGRLVAAWGPISFGPNGGHLIVAGARAVKRYAVDRAEARAAGAAGIRAFDEHAAANAKVLLLREIEAYLGKMPVAVDASVVTLRGGGCAACGEEEG